MMTLHTEYIYNSHPFSALKNLAHTLMGLHMVFPSTLVMYMWSL